MEFDIRCFQMKDVFDVCMYDFMSLSVNVNVNVNVNVVNDVSMRQEKRNLPMETR